MHAAEPDDAAPQFPHGDPPLSSTAVVEAAADSAVAASPTVLRMLDVGCGDGSLLRELALRIPYGELYCGIDPDVGLLVAAAAARDARLDFRQAQAEDLPFVDATFDLVVCLRSFHLWVDQAAGLGEIARVLRPLGHAVIVDRLATGPKGSDRVRSGKRLAAAAEAAGLHVDRVERVTRRFGVLSGLRGFVLQRTGGGRR